MADEWNFPKGDLMKGKKGLIMGVANDKSIAWGIACQLAAQGADIALSYLGESLLRRVQPLADSIGVKHLIECDVTSDASMDTAFAQLKEIYGEIDFLIHSVAFANKNELQGSFVENTTREGFLLAMNVSAFSFVDSARRAAELMPNGGSLITMTYLGSERVIPNYNTMGVAKAALEASTRYIARDLGPKAIRVNAISAGAMRTLSLAGISGGRALHAKGKAFSLMKEDTAMEGVAGAALWLASDLSLTTTGEVVHVDSGFHVVGLPDDMEM
ncbi:putative enoyl-{acyl-carrier-protein} reductase {NADH} [Asticcacaulis biprosthecium C19]|uniref:Enoyl-[acyl-carrier-protein] reductase [NADH] n=1 Tax=Asticcacaulis biprosthecium C19 TaxID=715226 RepID=F4QLG5_9CAUL|nr:enoyl-ACP reductase [Asticcacaulis biprosthecium]EGF92310.1 putative enoyl-{acyl-carrier-protein} reductase {NADH} [Asticcacaulis biprosthecium C19]